MKDFQAFFAVVDKMREADDDGDSGRRRFLGGFRAELLGSFPENHPARDQLMQALDRRDLSAVYNLDYRLRTKYERAS